MEEYEVKVISTGDVTNMSQSDLITYFKKELDIHLLQLNCMQQILIVMEDETRVLLRRRKNDKDKKDK